MNARANAVTFHRNAATGSDGAWMQSESSSVRGAFGAIVARGGNSTDIAHAAREVWQHIDASLSPIIGPRGVAALYRRSVHLLRRDHPSLDALHPEAVAADHFAELQRASDLQTRDGALDMNAAMLETFRDLLTKLIGASLSERLLQPAWDRLASNVAAEGPPP